VVEAPSRTEPEEAVRYLKYALTTKTRHQESTPSRLSGIKNAFTASEPSSA